MIEVTLIRCIGCGLPLGANVPSEGALAHVRSCAKHPLAAEREELCLALEGLLAHLGPGGYIPGAGEPATRRAQAALARARGRTP